jgi:hypothetical protein
VSSCSTITPIIMNDSHWTSREICLQLIELSSINKVSCYIAGAETKRDWLIRGHVALDKCNVSRPGNK